jgi:hypothetical protein
MTTTLWNDFRKQQRATAALCRPVYESSEKISFSREQYAASIKTLACALKLFCALKLSSDSPSQLDLKEIQTAIRWAQISPKIMGESLDASATPRTEQEKATYEQMISASNKALEAITQIIPTS